MLQENEKTKQLASSLFSKPTEISPNNPPICYLRKQPDNNSVEEELFVLLNYNVSAKGFVEGTKIIERNVPVHQTRFVQDWLRGSRFRPKIIDGKIVATEALQLRQAFKVID